MTARVSDTTGGGGIGQRWATWKAGAHVVAHRPLVGAGPGRFGAATLPYRTLAAVRQGQADAYYVDAHNIVVEYATTTGLLGLAALLAWLGLALRRASGPLLAFGAVLLVLHMAEPMSVGVTPLAFLALGAAGPMIAAEPRHVAARVATAALVPLALVAGVVLLAAGARLHVRGQGGAERGEARRGCALAPGSHPAGADEPGALEQRG